MNFKVFKFFLGLCLSAVLCSCGDKFDKNADDGRSIRSFRKTVIELDPNKNRNADAQAFDSATRYKVWAISNVKKTTTGNRVTLYISQPPTPEELEKGNSISDTKIEVTTVHENGVNDYSARKSLPNRRTLDLIARCSSDECERYDVILNTGRGGTQVEFQNYVVAFKRDCKFYSSSVVTGSGLEYLTSINDARKMYFVTPQITACQ
jgi:hypothetical protein